jgi:hypothetical protein
MLPGLEPIGRTNPLVLTHGRIVDQAGAILKKFVKELTLLMDFTSYTLKKAGT